MGSGYDETALASADHMFTKCGCCCFWVPWPGMRGGCKAWERIRPLAVDRSDGVCPVANRRWWSRGWKALLRARKTLIRRLFRRSRKHSASFVYDPMSYALNFDEGGQGSDSDGDTVRRGFSARYATLPASTKSSMDLVGRSEPLLPSVGAR